MKKRVFAENEQIHKRELYELKFIIQSIQDENKILQAEIKEL